MMLLALIFAVTFTRPMERVSSMDPIQAEAVYDCRAVNLVYETPLEIDYAARPYKLIPGLCTLPEVSEDGLRYRFKMTENSPVSASDVKRNLERLRDVKNVSPGGWTMKAVDTIDVTDSDELVITLKYRQHVFPWMLAMSYSSVMLKDGSGTGPYKLTKWWKGHEMVFDKNPAWRGWETNTNGFDKVHYLVIDDVSTQWLMFLKGEIDMLGEISRDNWDAIIDGEGGLDPKLEAEGVRLHGMPKMEVAYIGFNMRDKVVGPNKYLRQALNAAFDYPTWEKFYNHRIVPADGPVPFGVAGKLDTPFAYAYNLEKAKELLAKAGYPNGIDPKTGRRLTLTLAIGRPTQDSRESGELMASFLDKIGVKLELQFMTWDAFLRAVNEGRVQMYRMAWIGDYPDAENFLQLFHSANVSPGANHSNYINPEYDAAFDRLDWATCQEILREDCPWIYSHYSKAYTLLRPVVKNYIPSDFPYGQEKWYEVKGER